MDLRGTAPILDTAHNAFVSMTEDGRIAFWNPAAEQMFGLSREEAIGRVLADTIIPPRYRDAHAQGLATFLRTGSGPVLNQRIELSALRQDGVEIPVEITISALREAGGYTFHAFIQDISERRAAETERAELVARLEALARTDELTGLPNRRAWEEELRREAGRARRHGHLFTVVILDLDRFKAYNDRFGHQAGDDLLRTLGMSWRTALRTSDLVARYGGEEFVILLPQCPPRNSVAVMDRLRRGVPAEQTFSGGVAVWQPGESVEALMARADGALYEAKRAGRNRVIAA